MSKPLPRSIWVDKESLIRPQICSHMAHTNVFDEGEKYYNASQIDAERRLDRIVILALAVVIFIHISIGLVKP